MRETNVNNMKTWFRHKHNCCVDSYKKMKWQHSNIPSFATGEVSLSRLAAISYLYFYFIFFKIEHTHTHAHIDKGTVTHTLLHIKKETRTRMRVHIYWTQSHGRYWNKCIPTSFIFQSILHRIIWFSLNYWYCCL